MIDPDLIGFAIALVVLLLPVAGVLIYVRARDRRRRPPRGCNSQPGSSAGSAGGESAGSEFPAGGSGAGLPLTSSRGRA